jgi:drug/metabolite transporter (DMT)-like permease
VERDRLILHGSQLNDKNAEPMAPVPSRAKVLAAFAAIYIVWGSTYVAILYAIRTLPPFLMAGVRFVTAGAILYAWSAARWERPPRRDEWKAAIIVGALLCLGGNGAVVWAEQIVPSGVAALVIAITPAWIVLLDWLWHRSGPPGRRTVLGLLLGFGGIALLVGPTAFVGAGAIPLIGAAVLMAGSLSWSVGSLYSRRAPVPPGALLSTGMQMLGGGALLIVVGVAAGEPARLDLDAVSMESAAALAYLIIFGSIIGYSAYVWLLRVVPAARVATYAYVNPLVAVFLGWALAGEALTPRMALAAATIILGVALITTDRIRQQSPQPARVRE